MRRLGLVALIVVCCAAAVAATGCRKEVETTGGGRKAFTIGLIAKSSTNPVFQAARVGAVAKAAELSEKHGVDVKIDWQTPPKEDAQRPMTAAKG